MIRGYNILRMTSGNVRWYREKNAP